MKNSMCYVVIICACFMWSCVLENSDSDAQFHVNEQALNSDVTRGRSDAQHPHAGEDSVTFDEITDTNPPESTPLREGFVTGEEAEALIEALGLVSAPEVMPPPAPFCSTDAPGNRTGDRGLDNRPDNPPEPYIPSLWTEKPRPWPPAHIKHCPGDEDPPPEELSEMGQLLESYRTDGCANDRISHIPRCRNHPYRLALATQYDDLTQLPVEVLDLAE